MAGRKAKRILVVGLDCAAPRFVFGPDRFDLPNLQRLAAKGCWGRLRSCDPPITVPAWACMTSGKDPGVLGCYGFRNRRDYSYEGMVTANASSIRAKRVWDILSRKGRKVVVLGVPQTYPVRPVNGWLVADFLTPDTRADYTYPKTLKDELEQAVGSYLLDVKDFRTNEKAALRDRIFALMHNRFDAARFLMADKPWDFFMMVEMGVDRLHHAFWKYCDPRHPKFEPGNPYAQVFRDYYQALDARLGELLALAGDETAVMVVSDHGAKAMQGGICINQWLIENGWLGLAEPPNGRTRIEDCRIDWPHTRAWASGGYYGRVFLNVEGREPQGVIPAAEYDVCLNELIAAIEAMPGPDGRLLGNRALRPRDLYREVNGVPPDLFVYFGGLDWRSVGAVGFDGIYTFENDTGPDDANHDFDGIFIMDDGMGRKGEELKGLQLMDVAPTILELSGVAVPEDMQGKVIG
ncbi:MAG TPA: alkaline phosphatase family protein [Candidatus Hydrogenedentes bacterium]|nr:alkaline phosphatase family protein [Candidatus Hydrogenedentota bacterium]HPC15672.1 alkaline phosphatase family protein [Candidatus Hydrogenedentota bacterium]HRT19704.1 alkaline phosphatase family protein [Candidatus Hydrogenedentota bacterium]HRT64478.1 alkaline phosphatase family protein [Candidatus Hydrogenedentota bacterium]